MICFALSDERLATLHTEFEHSQTLLREQSMEVEALRTQNTDLHEQILQIRQKLTSTQSDLETTLRGHHDKDNEMMMMASRLQTLHEKLQTNTSLEYQHTEMKGTY